MQLGARFGTTSCVISHQLNNSGRLISVEPDSSVWNLLDENRRRHRCNFWLLRGVVADQPAVAASAAGALGGGLYSTRTLPRKESPGDRLRLGHRSYGLQELQAATNISLTALLIDCEGCIQRLFRSPRDAESAPGQHNNNLLTDSVGVEKKEPSYPTVDEVRRLLHGVHTIILEADMPRGAQDCHFDCVDYSKWEALFNEAGLQTVSRSPDPIYRAIIHYVFRRK